MKLPTWLTQFTVNTVFWNYWPWLTLLSCIKGGMVYYTGCNDPDASTEEGEEDPVLWLVCSSDIV